LKRLSVSAFTSKYSAGNWYCGRQLGKKTSSFWQEI